MSENLKKAKTLMGNSDLNVARLSALAGLHGFHGLSEATLSRALTAGKALSTEADKSLGFLVRRLEGLVNEVSPLAVSFANTERVKQLLDDVEARKIVFIVLSGLQPFKEN